MIRIPLLDFRVCVCSFFNNFGADLAEQLLDGGVDVNGEWENRPFIGIAITVKKVEMVSNIIRSF